VADGSLAVGKMGGYRSSLPHHHLLLRLRTSGAIPPLPSSGLHSYNFTLKLTNTFVMERNS
jgi:hypothetical protein